MGKFLPKKTSTALRPFLSVLSKPQIKHFLVYLVGLIWLIKFHSTREIASQISKTLPDNLQRFLNGSAKKRPRLREGKEIEGLGIHHSADGLVKGQCAVTCVLKIAGPIILGGEGKLTLYLRDAG